ncbi:UNVERIFIED_CONTAM: hypothetical protein FKN15_075733 [Acipenser sinensis]
MSGTHKALECRPSDISRQCLLVAVSLAQGLAVWDPSLVYLISFLMTNELDPLKSSDKICRQLIYHLTPHSKWLRQSLPRRKSQAW